MRLFITGATGFIGRPVCEALRGHELMVLTRHAAPGIPGRMVQGDLCQPETWETALAEFRPEACLHLAWEGLPDYSLPLGQRNFNAGLALLHALCHTSCRRVIVAGTCWEYEALTGCLREDQAPESPGLFAAFKTALRLTGAALLSAAGIELIWARPFFVYGPGQRPVALLPSAFRALSAGQSPPIENPDALHDFVHVDDVAAGLAALTTSAAPTGIYNLGSGRPTRVRDVVNTLARLMNLPDVFPPSEQNGQGFWADETRVRKVSQWEPRIGLEEGIRRTLAVWRCNP